LGNSRERKPNVIRRIILLLSVATLMAVMLVAMAMPAFAAKGGVPNEKACVGQVLRAENQLLGITPHESAEEFGLNNAGEILKGIKSGEFFHLNPETGEEITCPFDLG
jgi:hypothetical protein